MHRSAAHDRDCDSEIEQLREVNQKLRSALEELAAYGGNNLVSKGMVAIAKRTLLAIDTDKETTS